MVVVRMRRFQLLHMRGRKRFHFRFFGHVIRRKAAVVRDWLSRSFLVCSKFGTDEL